jgi:hypothetical protein
VGGVTSSCFNFIQAIRTTLQDLERQIKHHNRREANRFKSRGGGR